MVERRALVKNAGDPEQVRYAARKEKDAENQLKAALREVLGTPAGRLVWGEFLERAGIFEASFDHSGSVMYFREGRRNQGLEWQARLVDADEGLYELLERERRQRKLRLDRETAAVQQEAASRRQE